MKYFNRILKQYLNIVLSPKPIDQEPETSLIGLIIVILTTIILVLIVAIFFIVTRQKRTRTAAVLDALQHNLHSDGLSLGLDKRFNSNFKVSYLFYHYCCFLLWNKLFQRLCMGPAAQRCYLARQANVSSCDVICWLHVE